ncbi:helix-turn-helix domain-containing protein [Pontimicrobium sp. MEBiC06410]
MKHPQASHYFHVIAFILSTIICGSLHAQHRQKQSKIDSLSYLDYKTLKSNIIKNDSISLFQNISAYIKKGKRNNDTARILRGYRFYIVHSEDNYVNIKYCDSMIRLSSEDNFRNNHFSALFLKAINLYNINNYESALNSYIELKRINKTKDFNEDLDVTLDVNIGTIKKRLGYYEESLQLFLRGYNYHVGAKEYEYANPILHSIVDTYSDLKEQDSAIKYNNLLLKQINSTNKKELYPYYLLSQSVILFNDKKHSESIDFSKQSIPYLIDNKDPGNLMFSYYYLGKNYSQKAEFEKALFYLKKMDSLVLRTNDIHPTLKDGYYILINEYKKRKETLNELKYINRLLSVDSLIEKNYKSLSKKIFLDYDKPKFLESKENIIKAIKQDNKTSNTLLAIVVIISLILLCAFVYLWRLNKRNLKKFKQLIEKNISTKNEPATKPINSEKELNISQTIIDEILSKIERFEKEVRFIDSKITLNGLSEEFGTNPKYLSKIIHKYKCKKFKDYINQLRIDYSVELIQNDYEKYSRYSIKGIANEVGFNSRDSFSAAFVKNTGISPSFFLKKLKNKYA